MAAAALAILIVFLDQATKLWVWSMFVLGETRPLVPGLFNVRYVRNDGAAFGLFSGQRGPLIAVSLLMLGLLIRFRRDLAVFGRTGIATLGLLLGGIVGNLLDRLRFGYVIDFLDLHHGSRHFPAFNVADAAISLGVALYLWLTVRSELGRSAQACGASEEPES